MQLASWWQIMFIEWWRTDKSFQNQKFMPCILWYCIHMSFERIIWSCGCNLHPIALLVFWIFLRIILCSIESLFSKKVFDLSNCISLWPLFHVFLLLSSKLCQYPMNLSGFWGLKIWSTHMLSWRSQGYHSREIEFSTICFCWSRLWTDHFCW